jgi:RNA polymerase sigma-70 factor (ECF subfamily)
MTKKLTKRMRLQDGSFQFAICYNQARGVMTETIQSPADLKDMDQHAFGALVEPHRRELRAHCYRMLGSLHEAEDLVQETFWRAWDRRETYAGRAPLRAWLYRIATNLCIDDLRQRPRRGLPVTRGEASASDQPLPPALEEPVWLEPYPSDLSAPEEESPEARYSRKESIQLAFLASLQLLPPRQRAALILRDVLGWRADEAAEALEQTVPAVKSALHRGRATLAQHRQSLQRTASARPAGEEALRGQLERYVSTWERADVDGLVALLKEDCSFSMPPTPSWYLGRASIAALVGRTIFSGPAEGRWRLLATRANGQTGFGLYRRDEQTGGYEGYGIQVLTFAGEMIVDITTFRTPALVPAFGLPQSIPAEK